VKVQEGSWLEELMIEKEVKKEKNLYNY